VLAAVLRGTPERPDVLAPRAPVASAASADEGAAPRPWTRRHILAILAVVFAFTGSAMVFAVPGTPEKLLEAIYWSPSAPYFLQASQLALPALFGLAVAWAVRLDGIRAASVAMLGSAVYQLAAYVDIAFTAALARIFAGPDGTLSEGAYWAVLTGSTAGGMVAASLTGALGMLAVLAPWRRPSRRTVLITALAGVVSGVLFYGCIYTLTIGAIGQASQSPAVVPGTKPSGTGFTASVSDWLAQRGTLALPFVLWQMLVGLVLVSRALPRSVETLRDWSAKPVLAVAALAVLTMGLGSLAGILAPDAPGTSVENPKDKSHYAWIPPGQFQMGCSADDEECGQDEQPTHHVSFTKGFWLQTTEATVKAWKATSTPLPPAAVWNGRAINENWAYTDWPIMNVTWQEARDYCAAVDGRLPTEAEWEYAARAGTTRARYGKLKEIAVFADTSSSTPINSATLSDQALQQALVANENGIAPPGMMARGFSITVRDDNDWNLTDVLGNVGEWVEDDYTDVTYSLAPKSAVDPPAHRVGGAASSKVVRGGSWASRARDVRVSARGQQASGERSVFVGVRCVWNGPTQR